MINSFGKLLDAESQTVLEHLRQEDRVRVSRIPGVRTVLVVLSSNGMVFDTESLRQKILISYPDSTVFFMTSSAKFVGSPSPQRVDLVIDFIGAGQRQRFLLAKKLRGMARVVVGRKSGFLRKRIYDRIFDDVSGPEGSALSSEVLNRERQVQESLLRLAGVAVLRGGETPPDRGKTIALELPPMLQL